MGALRWLVNVHACGKLYFAVNVHSRTCGANIWMPPKSSHNIHKGYLEMIKIGTAFWKEANRKKYNESLSWKTFPHSIQCKVCKVANRRLSMTAASAVPAKNWNRLQLILFEIFLSFISKMFLKYLLSFILCCMLIEGYKKIEKNDQNKVHNKYHWGAQNCTISRRAMKRPHFTFTRTAHRRPDSSSSLRSWRFSGAHVTRLLPCGGTCAATEGNVSRAKEAWAPLFPFLSIYQNILNNPRHTQKKSPDHFPWWRILLYKQHWCCINNIPTCWMIEEKVCT